MLKLGTYEAWFDGEVIVPGETLEERLANLEGWGYQGIQLHRRTAELGVPALKKALAGSSVRLCIYGGGGGLLAAEEGTRQAAVAQIVKGLHQAAELGAIGSIVVPVRVPEIAPPEPPKTLYDLQCEILIDELAQIAPTAEETGALVVLEPLNRYESRFLNRLDQAAAICRAVGRLPRLRAPGRQQPLRTGGRSPGLQARPGGPEADRLRRLYDARVPHHGRGQGPSAGRIRPLHPRPVGAGLIRNPSRGEACLAPTKTIQREVT
jgi:hypothetical protein